MSAANCEYTGEIIGFEDHDADDDLGLLPGDRLSFTHANINRIVERFGIHQVIPTASRRRGHVRHRIRVWHRGEEHLLACARTNRDSRCSYN